MCEYRADDDDLVLIDVVRLRDGPSRDESRVIRIVNAEVRDMHLRRRTQRNVSHIFLNQRCTMILDCWRCCQSTIENCDDSTEASSCQNSMPSSSPLRQVSISISEHLKDVRCFLVQFCPWIKGQEQRCCSSSSPCMRLKSGEVDPDCCRSIVFEKP